MPREWDGFLEGLARSQAHAMADLGLIYGEDNQPANETNELEWTQHECLTVLRAKLLPLLEAGQAMRQYAGRHHEKYTLAVNPNCEQCTAILGYDALRAAALKGSEHAKSSKA